jgi:hypothetical protein
MTKRAHTAHVLAAYFEEKGHILTADEYKKQTDTPIRFAIVKKTFGSWNRMENIVRAFNIRNQQRDEREPLSDVDQVIARNAAVEAEYAEKMKAASENLEAKTAREQAAKDYIEADKLNAITAEGAYENKMRKGGVTSQDAKAAKEAVEQALAVEHAMLAKTGAGAALGKHLLGGVEDNDEKTRVIEEQNAFRTKTKLMAATPLGAAEAKLIEDDTDGQLTREAQARIRNELRPYVPPVADGNVEKAQSNAMDKVRDEVREVIKAAAGDENVLTDSVFRATLARERAHKDLDAPVLETEIPEDVMLTMPPASQLPDEDIVSKVEFRDKDGKVTAKLEEEDQEESRKEAEKLSEGEKKANEKNPAAPPATRNPDPKVAPEADPKAGDKQQNNDGAAKPATPKTAPKAAPKAADKK